MTDLLPNTLYTVSLTLSFEGGQLGPAVKRLVTTPEDGERGREGGREGGREVGYHDTGLCLL